MGRRHEASRQSGSIGITFCLQEVGWVELAGSIVWIEASNPAPKGILPLAKFYLLKVL